MKKVEAYFKTFRYTFDNGFLLAKFSALLNFGTEVQNIEIGHEARGDGM